MSREYFDYNSELEKIIIGSILIESTAFARIKGLVESEMFYNKLFQDVFSVIYDMFDKSIPIDLVTVTQKCYDLKLNEKHELLAFNISKTINQVASTAHLEYHSLTIRELYLKRLLAEIRTSINLDNDTLNEVQVIEEKLKKARQINVTNDWESFKDIIMNIRINLENPLEDGIHIGIPEFDNIAGGLQNAEVCVIGARPSVGKTAFACQVAISIATSGKNVGIISLEMSNTKLSTRILSQISGIEYWKIDRHLLNNSTELDKINTTIENNYNLPISFSEKTGVTVSDIRAKALKAKHNKNLDILFIDYLGLIEPEKANNREQEISKISRGLKLLAMELNIPIVILAQLNRETETTKSKPKLSNLRDSGSIEQDADIVMFIHSDFKAGILNDINGNSTEHHRNIIVAKYRNGFTKNIELGWQGDRMKFIPKENVVYDVVNTNVKQDEFNIF